jgi:hypothetical protein
MKLNILNVNALIVNLSLGFRMMMAILVRVLIKNVRDAVKHSMFDANNITMTRINGGMNMSEFSKAIDLKNKIQAYIEQYGEDLEIAFYVDDETINTATGSVIGSIKPDGVEITKIPRLNLTFETI